MLRKGFGVGVLCLVVVGVLVWVIGSPAGAGQGSVLPVDEIRGLRVDIAALRADIKELRTELQQVKSERRRGSSSRPVGAILSPTSGASVPRAFTVEGTLAGIPADRHVWLAVRIGDLMWPKEPEVSAGAGPWRRQVVEGGSPPDGRFSLVLLMVDTVGQSEIQAWFQHGKQTGDYPGLAHVTGSVELAARDLVLR